MMKMTGVLLLSAVCVVLSLGVKDECMERYKICSAKDRYIMQKICRKNGGLLKHTLKYARKEIISDCCRSSGCTRQYLCDFCESSCCQVAIDMMIME
ncbi:putative insulin-like peptide [Dirofilaria immitis]